jgi:hypothetical protein
MNEFIVINIFFALIVLRERKSFDCPDINQILEAFDITKYGIEKQKTLVNRLWRENMKEHLPLSLLAFPHCLLVA